MRPRRSLAFVGSLVTLRGVVGAWTPSKYRQAFVTSTTCRIRRVQQHRTSPPSPTCIKAFERPSSSLYAESSQPIPNEQRKKKKNKYAQFSKSTTLDPLDEMLLESRSKLKELAQSNKFKTKKAELVDGSLEAVEELLASVADNLKEEEEEKHLWERNQRHFPDNKSIDPYDPTTYGYIELGK
jgi:hypothetical protein